MTDVWQVIGLRGTASDAFAVQDLLVPQEHSVRREDTTEVREPGWLYRFTTMNVFSCGFASIALGVARSNVSTSLKELMSWGLVKVSHVLGDRRDHYDSMKDLWEIFTCVVDERKKREIDPTLTLLRQCQLEAADDKETPAEIKQRITEITDFLETLTGWYEQMNRLPKTTLVKLMKLGSKITKVLGK